MEGEISVSESNSTPSAAPEVISSTSENSSQSTENVSHETSESSEISGQSNGKPAGFDPVDVDTASPEQIKARIDRLYANAKRYEGIAHKSESELRELRQINQQLISTVEQLHTGQQQIVSHLQTSDFQEAEVRLQGQRDSAWKSGDLDAYHKANDALVDIRARKAFAENTARQQPRQQQQVQQQQPLSGDRLVNSAVDKGGIDSVDANIAKSWMSEIDTGGNLKRAWTQPNDPRNYAAALEAQAVFNSPLFSDKPMADKLREIDRRMGVQTTQQPSGQNVLGAGNLTRGGKNNNMKLTDVERTIAVRTKFGGPKAKSDEDHAQAYLKAKIKSQPKGASR